MSQGGGADAPQSIFHAGRPHRGSNNLARGPRKVGDQCERPTTDVLKLPAFDEPWRGGTRWVQSL